jgi:hypothetical protein
VLFVFLSTGGGEPGAEAAERFATAVIAAGGVFVDTRDRLSAVPRGELVVRPDDGHPNARAHALYAEVVAKRIREGLPARSEVNGGPGD